MDEKTKENLKNLVKQTESSQLSLEQSAFTALNQQDKVLNLTRDSMDKVVELLSFTEGISFETSEITALMEELRETGRERILIQNMDHFFDMISQQQILFNEISVMLKTILEDQGNLGEVVHKMEEDISLHGSDIEGLLSLVLNFMERS